MGSPASTSTTPSARSTGTPSRLPRTATAGCGAEHPARHDRHTAGRARDRPGQAAQGQHSIGQGWGRLLAQAITTARAAGVTAGSCAGPTLPTRVGVVGTAIPNNLVPGHRPDDQGRGHRDRQDRRGRLVAIRYPRRSGRKPSNAGSPTPKSPRCRSPRHRTPQGRARELPADRAPSRAAATVACDGTEQGELFATYRHHAFVTNTPSASSRPISGTVTTRSSSRSSPSEGNALAHLPSGRYTANAAWVSLAVMAFNLARDRSGRRRPGQGPMGEPAPQDHQSLAASPPSAVDST